MTFYIEEAEKRGFNLNKLVQALRNIKEGEEERLDGIRAVHYTCCYGLWSDKGMMRIGLGLDESVVALALVMLSNPEP